MSRCVSEYPDDGIIEKYGAFDAQAIDELRTFPCIFAYETGNNLNPRFGVIRDMPPQPRDAKAR